MSYCIRFILTTVLLSCVIDAQIFVDSVVKTVESPINPDYKLASQRTTVSAPSKILITNKELSQFASVAELIDEKVPGVNVRTQGGIGSFSKLSIRGISGTRVAIYIDDVLMNTSSGTGVNLNSLPMSLFKQVEVYKGALTEDMAGTSSSGAIKLYTAGSENSTGVFGSLSAG
ncbi:MAG: Plug domain-containing protein, partial [Fibrobacteres bacterium]|nr:Plug domain-containing protein [Fibrobacterota bacterium]